MLQEDTGVSLGLSLMKSELSTLWGHLNIFLQSTVLWFLFLLLLCCLVFVVVLRQ